MGSNAHRFWVVPIIETFPHQGSSRQWLLVRDRAGRFPELNPDARPIQCLGLVRLGLAMSTLLFAALNGAP